MFIASVVVPILIFYFYLRTKREREKYEKEWRTYGNVKSTAILEGRILRTVSYKEKFYQDLYLQVTELWIDGKQGRVKAIKKEPALSDNEKAGFHTGEHVRLSGEWHHSTFYF
ncbi:hypothetical protein GCM10007216_08720 [Thalassobacillus devorans]|uniref:Uncharacterized protein n=1 Tax=Thalassobacillus devorans TaxID=279813 RepID=A0ABQ1NR33_9BACI|nr:hypothetical protein [Thalassobacillus devorans]NIK27783.1 protein tyrosine phosphatase [Thalassobacillus devorans]GGC80418.1 hypothetical protein GCM10007216_08720 [Thalassobacillus devorans]